LINLPCFLDESLGIAAVIVGSSLAQTVEAAVSVIVVAKKWWTVEDIRVNQLDQLTLGVRIRLAASVVLT
jgi:hypothetical protein